jgi:hypothetical protein
MTSTGSVTYWIGQLKAGSAAAAQKRSLRRATRRNGSGGDVVQDG